MAVLKTNARLEQELDERVAKCNDWLKKINDCRDLKSLLDTHREMWKAGLQHPGFGPDQYGKFRTDDIATMTADQVYLGNINGRWTNPVSFWESEKQSDRESYDMMVGQYKGILSSSVKDLRNQVYDNGYSRERICRNIENCLDETLGVHVWDVRIEDPKVSANKFLTVSFRTSDGSTSAPRRESTMVNVNGEFLIPEDFAKGSKVSRSDIMAHRYINISRPGKILELSRPQQKIEQTNTNSLSRSDLKTMTKNLEEKKSKGFHYGPGM